jgi:hypothetical protein
MRAPAEAHASVKMCFLLMRKNILVVRLVLVLYTEPLSGGMGSRKNWYQCYREPT